MSDWEVLVLVLVVLVLFYLAFVLKVAKGKLPDPDKIGKWREKFRRKRSEEEGVNVRLQLFKLYTGIFVSIALVLTAFLTPVFDTQTQVLVGVEYREKQRDGLFEATLYDCSIDGGTGKTNLSFVVRSLEPAEPLQVRGYVDIYTIFDAHYRQNFSVSLLPYTVFWLNHSAPVMGYCTYWILSAKVISYAPILLYEARTEKVSVLEWLRRAWNPWV